MSTNFSSKNNHQNKDVNNCTNNDRTTRHARLRDDLNGSSTFGGYKFLCIRRNHSSPQEQRRNNYLLLIIVNGTFDRAKTSTISTREVIERGPKKKNGLNSIPRFYYLLACVSEVAI